MNPNDLIRHIIVQDLEEAVHEANAQRRIRMPAQDPFSLPDDRFIKYFRLTKDLVRSVIEMVTPFVTPPTRASALTVEKKVLITLKFLGFGSYQEITGTNSYLSVSQATVSRAVHEVCSALIQPEIFNEWVHFPRNIGELKNYRQRFYLKYGLPGVVGCLDCTHVAIIRPHENEHIYVNRKGYHSINVQLICDEELKIININAQFPGSTHDSHIWRHSAVSQTMEEVYRRDNGNVFFLLGDSGYPLRPWLMTPLRDPQPNTPEERLNNLLVSIRSLIERCNGVLKNRFRCLLKHRVLHYTPDTAAKIINACVVLHNICIHHRVPEPPEDEGEQDNFELDINENNQVDNPAGRVNPDLLAARQLQRRIAQTHFRNN